MQAGTLRHLITIEQVTETRSATGAVVSSWATFATVRAEKITSGGREFYAAQKLNAETQVLYRIRYLAGVTAKMRISHGGLYDILNVADPDGRGREMHISCKAVV